MKSLRVKFDCSIISQLMNREKERERERERETRPIRPTMRPHVHGLVVWWWLPVASIYWDRPIFTVFYEIVTDWLTTRRTDSLVEVRKCVNFLAFLWIARFHLLKNIDISLFLRKHQQRTDRRTEPMDRWSDIPCYRDARTHSKMDTSPTQQTISAKSLFSYRVSLVHTTCLPL